MNFTEQGQGAPVLILHGSPADPAYFAPVVEALAPSHRVLLPDMPGYGRSPLGPRPYTLTRVLDELVADLQARGVAEVAVVGHSLGAYRALGLALRAGAPRVRALYLLSGMAGLEPELRVQLGQFADGLRGDLDAREVFQQRALAPAWAAAHPEHVAAVRRWVDLTPRETMAAEFDALNTAEDLRASLHRIQGPTVVRTGSEDAAWPEAWSRETARLIPGAVFEVVAGAGHSLLYEDREATVASVLRWASHGVR